MHKQYLMGIDNGGSVTKAAIYDMAGKAIAIATRNTEMITPLPFYTERDIHALWQANIEVIQQALRNANIAAADIAAISVTGHGNGLYLIGHDGQPVRNGIISTDNRAANYVKQWQSNPSFVRDILPKTMQSLWSGQPVALLAWLQEHEPTVLERTRYLFMVKDLIRYFLTGEAALEITDISGTNLLNVKTQAKDRTLFKQWQLAGDWFDKLPPIRNSTEQCGAITPQVAQLTGLKAGTPVSGGIFDISASALASGIYQNDKLCVVTGTWSINEYITDAPVVDPDLFMTSIYPIAKRWLITEASPTSASNLNWFVKNFLSHKHQQMGTSIYEYCNQLVHSTPADESYLAFFPFVFGSNTVADATAGFVGINSFHQERHFLRAIYEGVAFSHLFHINRLRRLNPALQDVIRIAGGVTHSPVWLQIFADIFDAQLEIADVEEHGALGAAMTAAVMLGEYKTIQEATSQMVRVNKTVQPESHQHDIYRQKYAMYESLLNEMKRPWQVQTSAARPTQQEGISA